MITLLCDVPKEVYVACSGGVDSMAALNFLSRKHKVTAAYFDHYTEHGMRAKQFVWQYCQNNGIPFVTAELKVGRLKHESLEEHWRHQRYGWLDSLNAPVVTAHHLDDAVETWIWSSMHGQPKLPEIKRGNVLRPFLATPKSELVSWCIRKNVFWLDDESNMDQKHMRNYVRHTALPVVQKINPGIHKTIKKKLTSKAEVLL